MINILKLMNYLAALLLVGIAGCSPKIVYQSSWQSSQVVADGEANEWKIPLRFYDPETKLNYTISNDKENLYLCIRATDEATQVKIMRAGMHIWIDTTGKKNKQIGIFYPMPNTNSNSSGTKKENHSFSGNSNGGNSGNGPNSESVHKSFLAQATDMQLTGFKPPIGGLTSLANNSGIKVGMNWDSSDILIYEAIIPFKTFSRQEVDSSKTISISVALDPLPGAPNSEGRGGGGGGAMRGGEGGMGVGGMGGGGMHGGGGHGGGYSSGGNDKSELYESQNFWVSIHLVSK